MQLTMLTIDRIVIHQIFKKEADNSIIPPKGSKELTKFDQKALLNFEVRIVEALGEGSRASKMVIEQTQEDGVPSIIDSMVNQDEQKFVRLSLELAERLAKVQSRRTPGGMFVLYSGTHNHPPKKFIGVIKAEMHTGYEKIQKEGTDEISLKFVQDILLTPSQKLYKTAAFFEKDAQAESLEDKWDVLISDSQINTKNGKAAAKFFYSDFLGCDYPKDSARITQKFYDETTKYITKLKISEEDKNDLLNALKTYLKTDKSKTASSIDFANKYLERELIDDYIEELGKRGMSKETFAKDTKYIKSNLALRKVTFKKNIKLTGPADTFQDIVMLKEIDGDIGDCGSPRIWTEIIVKDKINKHE